MIFDSSLYNFGMNLGFIVVVVFGCLFVSLILSTIIAVCQVALECLIERIGRRK